MDINNNINSYSLQPNAARNLAHTTKSTPIMESVSPRWLLKFLPWVAVEAGIYTVNKRKKITDPNMEIDISLATNEHGEKSINIYSGKMGDYDLPDTYPDYEEKPKEFHLSLVQTNLKVNTQVTDIYNHPIDQFNEQIRLTVEAMKERQELELINNSEFGLLNQVDESMKISTRTGAPTPDDMDELLSKVWKKPAFYIAHPKAIAAFGRECTKRGVPPVAINLYGSPFITWRGVPLIPCNKMLVDGKKHHNSIGKTNIILVRVGEKEQGVIGLHQPGVPDEKYSPSLSVKHCGINDVGISSYLLRLYHSAAVLSNDAIAVLQDVEVGKYHDYE